MLLPPVPILHLGREMSVLFPSGDGDEGVGRWGGRVRDQDICVRLTLSSDPQNRVSPGRRKCLSMTDANGNVSQVASVELSSRLR